MEDRLCGLSHRCQYTFFSTMVNKMRYRFRLSESV
jgi:hypothetical protein